MFSGVNSIPDRGSGHIPAGMLVYAIGDIHGRADLLAELVSKITADSIIRAPDRKSILVFVGDYIDRGLSSKDVIDYLLSDALTPFEPRFLMGNHEKTLLDFLRTGNGGPDWMNFGGAETLISYGVSPPRFPSDPSVWGKIRSDLDQLIPSSHVRFFETLEIKLVLGDYVFVHAGLLPGVPLGEQKEHDCLWIRSKFTEDPRHFEKIVVHGHTPEADPYRSARRIGIDTGAYITGTLTAARFQENEVTFLQTGKK